ncbi:hypothetical protein CHS0354_011131 [Potamilus streckersoni]|uniref:Uncharacterized protein n=1 Tax=Potamilus streckersoni TaxID=2493646 RepID=A0AAE0W7W5_9BIVA|nr:hypothetical protein CHS0354_011131 [Potamilus streckersoni]
MEGKSINHLSKVCCITVKPVIFLLSLLLLWVNVQATPTCTCDNINWEEAKCPEKKKTVVLVKVTSFLEASISNSEADSTYKVSFQRFGGESENKLTDAKMTLHKCSIPWTTSTSVAGSWFVIAGDKDTDGNLHVYECGMEQYLSGFFDKRGREHLHDIFKGLSTPSCPGPS